MKLFKKIIAVILTAAVLVGASNAAGLNLERVEAAAAPSGLKGVWFSFLDWQLFLRGKDKAAFGYLIPQLYV